MVAKWQKRRKVRQPCNSSLRTLGSPAIRNLDLFGHPCHRVARKFTSQAFIQLDSLQQPVARRQLTGAVRVNVKVLKKIRCFQKSHGLAIKRARTTPTPNYADYLTLAQLTQPSINNVTLAQLTQPSINIIRTRFSNKQQEKFQQKKSNQTTNN